MNICYLSVPSSEIQYFRSDLVDIYRRAFRDPPYAKSAEEVVEFAHFLPAHATAPGFRLVVALASLPEKAVGFAYGRTVAHGQPWRDVVEPHLRPVGLARWLEDAYQLVEMAVNPAAQGQGIGGRLHDRLLEGVPHRRAVLTTVAAPSAAYHLYLSKGWRVLVEPITVPQLHRPYRIMGLELSPGSS